MLKDYAKYRMVDVNKDKEFYLEVNWNPYDKEVTDSKLVRVTFPGGDAAIVKKDQFLQFLFAIGTAEEQRKMVPQVNQKTRVYETVIEIVAKKDVRKGEKLVAPLRLTLPTIEEEVIAEVKKEVGGHVKL